MLTAALKTVKILLSCCLKNSQDATVLTALKAVQDAEKITLLTKTKYRDLFLLFSLPLSLVCRLMKNLDHPGLRANVIRQ
jgi:hypothetical protein